MATHRPGDSERRIGKRKMTDTPEVTPKQPRRRSWRVWLAAIAGLAICTAILAVILLLFGAAKLPALAKSVGQSARVFKGEMKAMKEEDAVDASAGTVTAAESPQPKPSESSGSSSTTT